MSNCSNNRRAQQLLEAEDLLIATNDNNFNYRLLSDDATDRNAISPLLSSMVPMVLAPSGYRAATTHASRCASGEFPDEAVVILAELQKMAAMN